MAASGLAAAVLADVSEALQRSGAAVSPQASLACAQCMAAPEPAPQLWELNSSSACCSVCTAALILTS